MLLPVLKSRARAISEFEGACGILGMDTNVQLKRPLTSLAPAVIVLAGIAYAAPAPDIALALGKAVLLRFALGIIGLRYTFESAAKLGGRVSPTVTPPLSH